MFCYGTSSFHLLTSYKLKYHVRVEPLDMMNDASKVGERSDFCSSFKYQGQMIYSLLLVGEHYFLGFCFDECASFLPSCSFCRCFASSAVWNMTPYWCLKGTTEKGHLLHITGKLSSRRSNLSSHG